MLFYEIEDMKLFLESDCEGIVSLIIGPIDKKHYELICYVKNGDFRLLYAENDAKNLVEFLKSNYSTNIPFSEVCEKISKEKSYINAYKREFMKDIDISFLKEQLLEVKKFKSEGKKIENCAGLDGFHMDCNLIKTNEVFWIGCCTYAKEYEVIIKLANSLLEFLGVKREKFVICEKTY